jgi:prepilin-type processing-associated H-X9-DG protein
MVETPEGLGWVSGTRATLRNTGSIEAGEGYIPSATPGSTEKSKLGSLFVGGFGSYHPGGVNISLADGSTRFLSLQVDPQTLRQLGNRADGEIMKLY